MVKNGQTLYMVKNRQTLQLIVQSNSFGEMLNERKFNIKNIKMSEQMRTSVLDEVRRVIEDNYDDAKATQHLKTNIQKKYGGKWQVIIGKQMDIFFDDKIIKEFIELQTEIKIMIIFRRSPVQLLPVFNSFLKTERGMSMENI